MVVEMGQLYMIPDRNRIEESLELAQEYHTAFEYNDFFKPAVLEDKRKTEELISFYLKQPHDCSQDTMHGAFLDITIHSDDPLIRQISEQRVRQSMDIARDMGLRGVVFHTNRLYGFRDTQYIENWLEKNETFFRDMLRTYPKQQIFIENMFDEAPDVLVRLAERLQDEPHFGVCLDYAHAALSNIAGKEWIEALAPYVRHMHINDNDKVNDLHQELGKGQIDWHSFNCEMHRYEVETSVLVEMKDLECQRRSMQYMEKYGIYPFTKN